MEHRITTTSGPVSVRVAVSRSVVGLRERIGEAHDGSMDFSNVTTFGTEVWTDQFENAAKIEDRRFLRGLLRGYFAYGVVNPPEMFREIARVPGSGMLSMIPDDVILAPLMIKGYEFGRLVGYTLSTLGKKFDLVLLGYHKAAVRSRGGRILFSEQQLYTDKADEVFLDRTNKPLLVVDDVCEFFSFSNNIALRFSKTTNRDIFFLFGMRMPEALASPEIINFTEVAYDANSGRVLYKWNPKARPKNTMGDSMGTLDPVTRLHTDGRIELRPGNWDQLLALDLFRGRIASGKDVQESIETEDGGPSHVGFRVREFIVAEAVGRPFGEQVNFHGLVFNVSKREQGKVNAAYILDSNTVQIDKTTGVVSGDVIKTVKWPVETGWYRTDADTGVPYDEKSSWEDRTAVYLRRVRGQPYMGSLVQGRGGIGVLGHRRRGVDANYGPELGFGVAIAGTD